MQYFAIILLSIYAIALLFIFSYSMAQLHLLILYLKAVRKGKEEIITGEILPVITIQLPLYNEMYVVERLIDNIIKMDYPGELLEIQVLDDSTDISLEISRSKVNEYRALGFDIKLVRRPDRKGFKAGALQYGLESCRGEFIAIFDADFLPEPDFLKKTLIYFKDPGVGVVQTRWEHLNKNYSLWTRAQAFALDAHFSVEQAGRNYGGFFINFNGTGGIWRKKTILDAGGWEADTLTEDLDLSYRAQLKGWKFRFVEEVGSPAELPVEMNSIRSQQYRWTKGGAETAKKLFGKVLHSNLPRKVKIHAFFHLFNSSIFISVLLCSILSIPAMVLKHGNFYPLLFKIASIFLLSLAVVGMIYFVSFRKQFPNPYKAALHFLYMFPVFLSLSMGLSLHNTKAVLQGFAGKKTAFIRTPKFNITGKKGNWTHKKYITSGVNFMTIVEFLLTIYFLYGVWLAFASGDYGLLPLHLMLVFGFGTLSLYSVWHNLIVNR